MRGLGQDYRRLVIIIRAEDSAMGLLEAEHVNALDSGVIPLGAQTLSEPFQLFLSRERTGFKAQTVSVSAQGKSKRCRGRIPR